MERTAARVAVAAVVLALALVAAGFWLARGANDRVPPGVEIEGVAVGDRSHEEARALLRRETRPRLSRPVRLSSDDTELDVSPRELGAEPAIDAAFAEAEDRRGPVGRAAARLNLVDPVRIPLRWRVDPDRVEAVVERVAGTVEQEPQPASVEVRGGAVHVVPSQVGRELERDELARRLEVLPSEVEIPVREERAAVDDDEAARAKRRADRLLEDPPAVEFRETTFTVGRDRLLRALRFEGDGSITVALAERPLREPLRGAFGRHERGPRDASFVVQGDRVRIRESRRGRRFAVSETVAALEDARPGEVVDARFRFRDPEFTTEQARDLRIRRLVSEFETPYSCCPPRVTNIQRAAEILDGQIIGPGERYSLNEGMGERTRDRGFVPAPMILAGRLVDAVGGGVSQVATTVFNSAFFAGLELVEHTPHQFYIDRYPMGREATISWDGPELVFRNDWEAGILVKVEATQSSITVRFYSAPLGRRVGTETGEPYDRRPPRTRTRENDSLAPGERRVVQQAGAPGFSIDYTRTVWEGDEVRRDESFHVEYDPQNRIVEVGPRDGE